MVAVAASISECPDIEQLWYPDSSNSSVNVATDGILLSHSDVGPFIHIICPEGSHVVGPNLIRCLKDGVWDDETKPHCSTSSLYGIAQSDIIMIAVLAGCGAIMILALTIILSHLLCFRKKRLHSDRSMEELDRNLDALPASMYFDDKYLHTISVPTSATLNGRPLTRRPERDAYTIGRAQNYDDRSLPGPIIMSCNPESHEYSLPRYYLQSTRAIEYPHPPLDDPEHVYTDPYAPVHAQLTGSPVGDDEVFVNQAFNDTEFPSRDYRANWENDMNSQQALSAALYPVSRLPVYSSDNRTIF